MASKKITAVQFKDGETYTYSAALWDDAIAKGHAVALYGTAGLDALRTYRRNKLLEILKPGMGIKTVCVNGSSNGGASHYKLFVVGRYTDEGDSFVRDITQEVATFTGHKVSPKTDGIVMSGYGYSRSFQIVYSLGCALWPHGTPQPHGTRNGEPDSYGGYALKQY